jgi:hypothetical protein
VVARIATPIATFAQRGPGGTPGIAIDFIEVEHAAVLRATRAGAEPRQRLAALDDPYGAASLLGSLREAGAHEQAAALTARLSATGMFELFLEQKGAADQFRFGREADGTPAAPWGWEDLDLWLVPGCGHRRHRHGT